MGRQEACERTAARAGVGALILQCQTDGSSALSALDEAMEEAISRGWDDVRLALVHAQIVESQTRDPEASVALIVRLQVEAERLGMKAMEAVALVDRIATSRLLGKQEPYQTYAEARALLSDATQSSMDRLSGLINLAGEFEMIGLIEIADDALAEAAEAASSLRNSGEPLAVIAHNRLLFLLRRVMGSVMAGQAAQGRELFSQYRPLLETLDASYVPASWIARHEAYARVADVLLLDGDLEFDEAEELTAGLSSRDRPVDVMVRSMTPLDTWPEELFAADIGLDPEEEELVRFLRVRACQRAGADVSRYVAELEGLNAVVVARAEKARYELEAGMSAMVSAELLAAERGELVEMTLSDPLTGLSNRRAFQTLMQAGTQRTATLMLIDLDDFKYINDTFGHHAGDDVLVRLAELLAEAANSFRPEVVARIGGDEFAVILAGDRAGEASQIAVRFAASVKAADWSVLGTYVPSASVGIAAGVERSAVFEKADANLYERKRGRKAKRTATR